MGVLHDHTISHRIQSLGRLKARFKPEEPGSVLVGCENDFAFN